MELKKLQQQNRTLRWTLLLNGIYSNRKLLKCNAITFHVVTLRETNSFRWRVQRYKERLSFYKRNALVCL